MKNAIENRYDFVLFFDVENGNPNGDPDAGNMPRVDPETGRGIVTDVCIKRKIRNYVELAKEGEDGYDIYVTDGIALNSQHKKAYEAHKLEPGKKVADKEKQKQLTDFMCGHFYDIRTFGAVMSTSVNCGTVRGPVQLNFARSIDPILQQEVTITRVAITREEDNKETEMARKYIVPYGLYRMEGYVSAELAQRVTGFGEEDLDLLWEALINMFEHDHSAARGKMATRKLFVFKHDSKLGNAPSHVLFDKIRVEKQTSIPRSFSDYKIVVEDVAEPGVELIEKI